MGAYIYKLKHKTTGQIYIGTQYGKRADPSNFWTKYFTSCDKVRNERNNFTVVYVRERFDARCYEARLLQRAYNMLGRAQFLNIMINRNIAPGIIHDINSKIAISKRLKARWSSGEMYELHAKAISTRSRRGYKPVTVSEEERQIRSERMRQNNPMKSEIARARHKEAVNLPEAVSRKAERMRNNTYCKGKSWYNNGSVSKMFLNAPEGWVRGRINPHWNFSRNNRGKNG